MFITGCHRSGTSLLASVLREFVGVAVDHNDQMKPALDNPMGFHESTRLVSFNDALLSKMGCSWVQPPLLAPLWDQDPWFSDLSSERKRFRDLALNEVWLAKDPRLCLTYPAYVHVLLRRVPLIASIREPLAVASSLFARNGLPVNAGLCLWFIYNHHLSSALSSEEPVISYEFLLQAGTNDQVCTDLYRQISSWLEKNGMQPRDYRTWTNLIDRHLCPSLDRAGDGLSSVVLSRVNPALLEACSSAYNTCLKHGSDGTALKHTFDALPRVVLDIQQSHGLCPASDSNELLRMRELIDISRRERSELEGRLDDVQAELKALHESTSWRITSPLRSIMRLIMS